MFPRSAHRHRRRVWRRHSLLVRLLVICVAIAATSITATAWVATVSTSGIIQQQYSERLEATAELYDAALEYAATHNSWDGVASVLAPLAGKHDRRVLVVTEAGQRVFSSSGSAPPRGAKPTVLVNALEVKSLGGAADRAAGGIDPRVVGPFRLTEDERRQTQAAAQVAMRCLARGGLRARLTTLPSGRVLVVEDADRPLPSAAPLGPDGPVLGALPSGFGGSVGPGAPPPIPSPSGRYGSLPNSVAGGSDGPAGRFFDPRVCLEAQAAWRAESEIRAGAQLLERVNDCYERNDRSPIKADFTDPVFARTRIAGPLERACFDSARREQLAGYVAPPALLYVTGSTAAAAPGLSGEAIGRIGLLALLIIVMTVAVVVTAATRLTRPLRALTGAAQRVGRGDRSARVTTADPGQIGELAAAFNRMAEALNEAEERRKQMVSDVAHELRTPLGNIRGWLEAAQDGVAALDDKLTASLLDESLLLQRIIEDLQELALADAGQLVFHPEPIEAGDLLRHIAAAHRVKADAADVVIDVFVPRPVHVTADANRLRQAVGNLVSNAIRYTPAGGLVRLRADRSDGEVVIEVSDTGLGMTDQELEHVFDRFWRAEQSRSRLSGGSGLGLAITRHLIEAQSGTVTVRSSPAGGGTVFTIRLPPGEDDQPDAAGGDSGPEEPPTLEAWSIDGLRR